MQQNVVRALDSTALREETIALPEEIKALVDRLRADATASYTELDESVFGLEAFASQFIHPGFAQCGPPPPPPPCHPSQGDAGRTRQRNRARMTKRSDTLGSQLPSSGPLMLVPGPARCCSYRRFRFFRLMFVARSSPVPQFSEFSVQLLKG